MTDGLVLIDKPAGPTSHDIVDGIRRAMGGVRCGHAGTLDPFAGGLLVVALGRATRLLRFLSSSDKCYLGLVRLGYATDTDDATGLPLTGPQPVDFTDEALASALAALKGEFDQVSPAYSARKHEGVPLYRLARTGRAVPVRAAKVTVRWERCERIGSDSLEVRVTVSAGTYIRALARDLGASLGCGGHLAELRRITSGPFRVEDALAFPCEREAIEKMLIPLDAIPLDLPAMTVQPDQARLVHAGASVPVTIPGAGDTPAPVAGNAPGRDRPRVRILDTAGHLLAVAEILATPDGPAAQPRVVLVE